MSGTEAFRFIISTSLDASLRAHSGMEQFRSMTLPIPLLNDIVDSSTCTIVGEPVERILEGVGDRTAPRLLVDIITVGLISVEATIGNVFIPATSVVCDSSFISVGEYVGATKH